MTLSADPHPNPGAFARPASAADWDPTSRTRALSYRLVAWASETGTADEAQFAQSFVALLREIPYFRDHPDDIAVIDSHGSPVRQNVVALVRGSGRSTLALTGHYDTVSIGNYHGLSPLARDPDRLTTALIEELSGRPRSPQEELALQDLRSGDFIPGRGMLDMKSGIAAGIAVLERFAADEGRQGNLMLIVSPDEERESRGMRALRGPLSQLTRRWNIEIQGGINLDATSDQGDGTQAGRRIYHGSIGKLLPFAFVVGQSSHASYPFEGISAQLISAEILQAIEARPELCDTGAGEISPPPICLEARDMRDGYEVTTPERTWLAFNWLFHSLTAPALFAQFHQTVEAALARAMTQFERNAAVYAGMDGGARDRPARAGTVMPFAALQAAAWRKGGPAAQQRFQALAASLSALDNPLVLSRTLVASLVTEAGITGPTVIVGFAGLHYPHVALDPDQAPDRRLIAAMESASRSIERRFRTTIGTRRYFQGISDMSFFGTVPDAAADGVVADNTPAERLIERPGAHAPRFPVVNIGPWGREYHQKFERVHAPYAFSVLPALLWRIVRNFHDPAVAGQPEG